MTVKTTVARDIMKIVARLPAQPREGLARRKSLVSATLAYILCPVVIVEQAKPDRSFFLSLSSNLAANGILISLSKYMVCNRTFDHNSLN